MARMARIKMQGEAAAYHLDDRIADKTGEYTNKQAALRGNKGVHGRFVTDREPFAS